LPIIASDGCRRLKFVRAADCDRLPSHVFDGGDDRWVEAGVRSDDALGGKAANSCDVALRLNRIRGLSVARCCAGGFL